MLNTDVIRKINIKHGLYHILTRDLSNHITAGINNITIITSTTHHGVGTRAAIQRVGSGATNQCVGIEANTAK